MPSKAIEEFAQLLVQHTRDAAIRSCDRESQPGTLSPVGKRWRQAASTGTTEPRPEVVIPDCVDEVIFSLLRAVDEGTLRLAFTASDGGTVDLTEDGLGELAGWYMGSGGWRAKYSTERFNDDFADLAAPNE